MSSGLTLREPSSGTKTSCLESTTPLAGPKANPLSCEVNSVQVGHKEFSLPLSVSQSKTAPIESADRNSEISESDELPVNQVVNPPPPFPMHREKPLYPSLSDMKSVSDLSDSSHSSIKYWCEEFLDLPDDFNSLSLSELAFGEKVARTQSYSKHKAKRLNVKENKKTRYNKRRARRMKPNSSDPSGSFESVPDFPKFEEIPVQSNDGSFLDASFNDIIDLFKSQIPDSSDSSECDALISALESICILAYQLLKADGIASMTIAILAYMKMHTSQSIIRLVLSEIDNLVAAPIALDPNSSYLQDATDYVQLAKSNTAFKKISFLLSAAMSLSVCDTKSFEWKPFGFSVICLEALKEQVKPLNLIDTILSTFKWFYETGSECIRTGSLVPILYSDQNVRKFHEDCEEILAQSGSVLNGNSGDLQQFGCLLDATLQRLCEFKKAKSDGPSAAWLQSRYEQLVHIQELLACRRKSSALRKSPFGIAITGSSGIGKSTLSKILGKVASMAILGHYDPTKSITIDTEDKHQNTYTSDIEVCFFDDVGNGKAEFQQLSPSNMLIKFFNNVAAQAIKAELNAKGVCYIDFKIGVITSNFETFNIEHYTNAPEAVLRRFFHVKPRVRPEYRIRGGVSLDTSSVPSGALMLSDVWYTDIKEVVVYESSSGCDTYKFVYVEFTNRQGKRVQAKNLNLVDTMLCFAELAKKHSLRQDGLIKDSNEFDNLEFCVVCCLPKNEMCTCNSPLCAEDPDPIEEDPDPIELLDEVPFCEHCCMPKDDMCVCSAMQACEDVEDSVDKSNLVPNSSAVSSSFSLFIMGECSFLICHEPKPELLPNSSVLSDMVTTAIQRSIDSYVKGWTSHWFFWEKILCWYPVNKYATRQLTGAMTQWGNDFMGACYRQYTPRCIQDSFLVKSFQYYMDLSANYMHLSRWTKRILLLDCGYGLWLYYNGKPCTTWTLAKPVAVPLAFTYFHHRSRRLAIQREYMRRPDTLFLRNLEPTTGSEKKKSAIVPITGAFLGIGIALVGKWLTKRTELEVNSTEKQEVTWMGLVMEKLHMTVKVPKACSTATTEQISSTVKKSVAHATFSTSPGKFRTNSVVIMQKGIYMFPEHVFYEEGDPSKQRYSSVSVHTELHDGPNGHIDFIADEANCVVFPNGVDLVLCNVERCPDAFDFFKWLPESYPKGSSLAKLCGRRKNEFFCEPLNVTYKKTGHKHNNRMQGGEYTHKTDYFGLCTTPVIVDGKSPCVVGFHIASDLKSYGAMVTITQSDYKDALEELRKLPGVLVASRGELLPNSSYGSTLITGPVHPKSAFSCMDFHAKCTIHGSVRLRRESKSTVEQSVISDYVSEITGVENTWGPPQLRPNWEAFNATLAYLVDPWEDFPPSHVQLAREDFLKPLLSIIPSYAKQHVYRPLEGSEIVLGVPGEPRINALDMSTSCGFPLFGPKTKEFEEIRNGEILVDRIPSDRIKAEVSRLVDSWKKDERAYPIVSACLKDEPTLTSKKKVRVFFIAPVALSLCIRKYFLPILGFLSANRNLCEQAVGSNCFGPGWEELMVHMETFAEDDLFIGWDYSKYDTRQSSQLTTASWLTLINMAEVTGYSPEDLQIMRAMITDIVHPVIDYNGTLVSFTSINTSGHNCTVDVNGLCNSILNRIAFGCMFEWKISFRDCVAIMTYGDDLAGSVHPDARKFNFSTVRAFFAERGIIITLPDKSDTVKDFLPRCEVDFLKRSSQYIPEIDSRLGKLDENSIFKSLHCNLVSKKVSKREVSASAIVGAMHEWFAHGRSVYNMRQSQMQKVCERAGLELNSVDMSFDERAAHWLENYR